MKCRNAVKLFSDFLEGALSGERVASLKLHLECCSSCTELLDIMRINRLHLQGLPEAPLPRELEDNILAIPFWSENEAASASLPFDGVSQPTANEGAWFFSNAAAAVILAIIVTLNLTLFNPRFHESVGDLDQLLMHRETQVLEISSRWQNAWTDLKQKMIYRLDLSLATELRTNGENERSKDQEEFILTEFRRFLELMGT